MTSTDLILAPPSLFGAPNPYFAGSIVMAFTSQAPNMLHYKLTTLTAETVSVPRATTIPLLGLGLMWFAGARRKGVCDAREAIGA